MVPSTGIENGRARVKTLRELLPPALVAAGAGVWDYDAIADRCITCGMVAHLYGLPDSARFTGVSLARLAAGVHPEDRQGYLARVAGLRAHGGAIDVLYRTVSSDGDTCHVLVRGRCDVDASGAVVHASGLVLDVTGTPQDDAVALIRPSLSDDALTALNLAADYGIAARRVIEAMGPAASQALRSSADAFLRTLAQEIATAMSPPPSHVRHH